MKFLLQLLRRRPSLEARRNTESLIATFGPLLQWTSDDMDTFVNQFEEREPTGEIRLPAGSSMKSPEFVLSWKAANGPWSFHLSDPIRSTPTSERIELFTLLNRSLNSLHLLNVPLR